MGSRHLTRALELARDSHGVLTLAQLAAAGIARDVAERQVRTGRWQRPARGVYVPHVRELTDLELARAAARLAGGEVVVSGLVALRQLELRWIPSTPTVLALVHPQLRTPSSGRVVLRRTKGFSELSTWTRSGVRFTSPARAVVDGARELDRLRDVRGIVLGAVADGWADVDALRSVLDSTQRNGSGLTRQALRDAERGCASPPEAELVDALVGCGRPFYVNPQLFLDGRLLGSPDVWLVGLGTGGEVESKERHGSLEQTASTYDRHERMTAPGLELVHLSVGRIRRDVREAAAHLLSRAAEHGRRARPEPAGLVVVPRGPLLR